MKTCNDAPVGYTDHPPVGEWQPWSGGACPVHPLATVEYIMRGGDSFNDLAGEIEWSHEGDKWDVKQYRITDEYKAPAKKVPMELWLSMCTNERSPDPVEGWLHVREVLE